MGEIEKSPYLRNDLIATKFGTVTHFDPLDPLYPIGRLNSDLLKSQEWRTDPQSLKLKNRHISATA